ncbi:MAG: hypothetical protein AAB336_11545 [Acidobacteriota bacterium]
MSGHAHNTSSIQLLRIKAVLFALRVNELFGGCRLPKTFVANGSV